MQLSLPQDTLTGYVKAQLDRFFPDGEPIDADFDQSVAACLERLEYCFSRSRAKHSCINGQARFNHLNTDQYATFLYFLSNTVHRRGGRPSLAAKLYALNKALHALDVFYEVALPEVFFQHPVGTVLGRGHYSNYLVVFQRCTVGGNLDLVYPKLGEGVALYGGSAVIGDTTVGDNCWILAGTIVIDQPVPSGTVTFGRSPEIVSKPARRRVIDHFFTVNATAS